MPISSRWLKAASLKAARSAQISTTQHALFAFVLVSLGVALGLGWLRGIVGDFAGQIFWRLTFAQDLPVAAAMALVALLLVPVASCLGRVSWRTAWPATATLSEWIDRHIVAIALAMLPFYAALTLGVQSEAGWWHPFSADEASALAQSRIFAAGQLQASVAPPLLDWMIPAEFQGHFFQVSHARGALTSTYWPGFALLLTPFSALGMPWLCNPMVTCASIWVLHRATKALLGSTEAAAWATIFFIASPVIALNATTFYAMPAHQLANLGFCALLAQKTRRGALGAGIIGGFALILHNPAPHGLFAVPWMVWMARRQRALLAPLLLGYGAFLPLGFAWSAHLGTFEAARQITASWPEIFAFPSLAMWLTRLAALGKVCAWAAPGLVVWAYFGAKIEAKNPFVRLLCASLLFSFAGFLFVRFAQGAGWGFRYLHQVWFVFPMLAGAFLSSSNSAAPLLRRVAALGAVLSFALFLPWRVVQVKSFLREHRAQIPAPPHAGASLRFIRVERGFHTAALVQNDPFLRGEQWNLVDHGAPANAQLARQVLVRPRRIKSGAWGEIWSGDGLRRHLEHR